MRLRAVPFIGLLVLATAGAQEADSLRRLTAIRIEGGDEEDRRFAVAALGLKVGQELDGAAFQQALAAVRLVDRYRSVEGTFGVDGQALLRLDPLTPMATWRWEGDAVPRELAKTLLPELRKGQRLGSQRRSVLTGIAEQRLREAGYPAAKVSGLLEQGGRHLRLVLELGAPARIREIRLEGDPRPYSRETLLKVAGLRPGTSFWTPTVVREAQRRIRQRLVKDRRLEGSVRLEPTSEPEVMLLEVRPGPKVYLQAKGLNLLAPLWGQPRLSEFVPLARAERYAPSLLDEGAGRITTYFRNQGFPEAKVSYERVVTSGTTERPEAVTLTYSVERGPRRTLGKLSFEGQKELSEEELRAAVVLPRRFLVLPPHAKAEVVKGLEDRLTAFYLQRGFPEVRVRRRVDTAADGSVEVRLIIREGQRRYLDALVLDLPDQPGFSRERLSQSLLLAMSDRPVPVAGNTWYRSDRRHLQGFKGTMTPTPQGVRLSFQPALPLVRNDLALVVSDLRQRLSSAGAANPQVKLAFEDDGDKPIVRIQVPPQPLDHAKRLVVQGSDRTRAEAVLREAELPQGAPLDPVKLDEGQVRLGGLGAFQRVDLLTLKDLPEQEQQPWQRGDLALRLQERSPWVFTESFGYDKTQGYHFGLNAQRLNVGGMGRVLDFGLRAGDNTLNSEPLRRAFPTGDIKRSVDSYSIGYTDPWFLPNALDSWLASRTRLHLEGAYIEEAQAAFFARRRRFSPSLDWKVGQNQAVQIGYRFERVEVAANTDSNGVPLISDKDLFLIARTPARSIISAPYVQVAVDRRDRPYDPTEGTFFLGRLELANQVFGTSANSSFVKLDLRHQWNWGLGFHAENGVIMASLRLGLARPTDHAAEDLPLSERFFGGGSFTVRGVEPDMLGEVRRTDGSGNLLPQIIPLGGQALAVVNLEYRFPLIGQSIWAEVFVDSGQVYRSLRPEAGAVSPFPPLRTTLGAGLILKLGFPLKLEYAADWKRIMGKPRTADERDTQLKSLLISAGFQF
ncbi:MAG: BamA/TamA family outer membrane protein [Geothrix sp.]|uniref:BamA/OMP85 family outer membrane protein n=1 Tax=Geothrix sp. TaxID=1962974 RepID=UPI0017D48473|nr:BamA/TamA family outer membrane protein [Geothrix sp.]NWJ40512.1 BamA/TamA family outer membrane protein [Geothrix sp.]WIL21483.1 MAG: BamA/TamA family outer membrane protein [Geothrix sp.]